MTNNNIHILDEELIEEIYQMLLSNDEESIKLGFEILLKRDKSSLASENIYNNFIKRLRNENHHHLIYEIQNYILKSIINEIQ